MTILWMNLIIVFFFSFFARYSATTVLVLNKPVAIIPNKLLLFGSFMCLVLISGLRSNIGDTPFYMHAYNVGEFSWELIDGKSDVGFWVLQLLLKSYISQDPQILIFTAALITNGLILITLYKYSRMIELSLFVYIASGMFLVSMNGIRQFLAASIIFIATKYLIEKNWIIYFLIVIFASLFHLSALILLPIYFLVQGKPWSKATLMVIIAALIIVVGFEKFTAILFTAIEDTQYGHYRTFSEGGASTMRVAVTFAPLLIAYLGREKLKEIFPASDVIVNMALIGFVFMLISTQNWIFARFSIYFGLYQLILISWIIKLFRKKDEKIIYFCILVCYTFYFYYEHVISLGIEYRSQFL
ncbi:EpsG family protein [Rossellomorea aquimaris]|uniref:EpsG family protein n=1 Tax=Rossellomorea aquimaris TaxID=189382 RepID=UPI0007D0A2CC|nr:EpsG family protein [Rossellomorea aquimaris]